MKQNERQYPTVNATMSEWVHSLCAASRNHKRFVADLLQEEAEKVERLARLSSSTGLPIYESFRFSLPSDYSAFQQACQKITANTPWELAIRTSRSDTSEVVSRDLGITSEKALSDAKGLCRNASYVTTVSPYKRPARSGTLLIVNGCATMEFAFGPHTIISQGAANGVELLHCRYDNYSCSTKYSTTDEVIRAILFATFRTATHLTLGCSVKKAVNTYQTVYAEFHWHEDVGFRFIECSFSALWTGKKLF